MNTSEQQPLPLAFIKQMQQLLSKEEYPFFEKAIGLSSSVSIRLNAKKQPQQSLQLVEAVVPWCDKGRYLKERATFTFDPLWHAGSYYVQEASSMFVNQVMQQYLQDKELVALDLCAAPGGKSTLLRSILAEDSFLIVNEVIRSRAQILAENMIKWGHPQVAITQNDPADFKLLKATFGLILADVPCSGEGMFRKDAQAIEEWSPEHVEHCAQRQRRIVNDIWDCLAPGGIFIYSTCTYNSTENEENVAWMAKELGAKVLPVEIKEDWCITPNLISSDFPVYRFMPHKTKGEGLFLAVLQKEGEYAQVQNDKAIKKKKKKKTKQPITTDSFSPAIKKWIKDDEKYSFVQEENTCIAFPKKYQHLLHPLASLRVLQKGLPVALCKGKNWIPTQALANSIICNKNDFSTYELSYDEAIAYLRKEALILPATIQVGYVLVTYAHQPLGWVKNIGKRSNNLYPNEWRIRSGYMPEEIKCLYQG